MSCEKHQLLETTINRQAEEINQMKVIADGFKAQRDEAYLKITDFERLESELRKENERLRLIATTKTTEYQALVGQINDLTKSII